VPSDWIKAAEGGVEHLMNVYVSMGVTPPAGMPAGWKTPAAKPAMAAPVAAKKPAAPRKPRAPKRRPPPVGEDAS
jgi:uncharacterized membrane protein